MEFSRNRRTTLSRTRACLSSVPCNARLKALNRQLPSPCTGTMRNMNLLHMRSTLERRSPGGAAVWSSMGGRKTSDSHSVMLFVGNARNARSTRVSSRAIAPMGITLAFGGDRREASASVGECDVTHAWWKNSPGDGHPRRR